MLCYLNRNLDDDQLKSARVIGTVFAIIFGVLALVFVLWGAFVDAKSRALTDRQLERVITSTNLESFENNLDKLTVNLELLKLENSSEYGELATLLETVQSVDATELTPLEEIETINELKSPLLGIDFFVIKWVPQILLFIGSLVIALWFTNLSCIGLPYD